MNKDVEKLHVNESVFLIPQMDKKLNITEQRKGHESSC